MKLGNQVVMHSLLLIILSMFFSQPSLPFQFKRPILGSDPVPTRLLYSRFGCEDRHPIWTRICWKHLSSGSNYGWTQPKSNKPVVMLSISHSFFLTNNTVIHRTGSQCPDLNCSIEPYWALQSESSYLDPYCRQPISFYLNFQEALFMWVWEPF